ncbi:MAG: DASH family cryptochrome [Saprospiraceae bacterium]
MQEKRAIVWFRQDLRLHDNEALIHALKNAEEVIPVYVFDERVFKGKTRFGFPKTGSFRAQFIIESVQNLRQNLRAMGSDLVVRVGKPEEVIFALAQEVKSSWVFCNRERTAEEVKVQDALEQKLWSIGQEMRFSRGKMLYYTADLPFPIHHTPDSFTQFRKEVERIVKVRPPHPVPKSPFPPLTIRLDYGPIPCLKDLGLTPRGADAKAPLAFKGGETEGLKRLHYFIWETKAIRTYKETRNELLGVSYSSRFSAWLSQGCLSPKMIYQEIKRFEEAEGANESTYWLFFELLWRDFFRFMGKKHSAKIFLKGGIKGEPNTRWSNNHELLNKWINGQTGVPFIDANMRELKSTGFMSNRGRQNVASFLVKDLEVNWQMGAEYFESVLIDYDPCSNYGNWNYIAGVGSDPRENRYFNILTQAKKYDPQGDYVKYWLPVLEEIPAAKVHQPDTLSPLEQEELAFKLGEDYPYAMVSTAKWAH